MFESVNPEFYLAHFDLTTRRRTPAVGPSGLPILMTFVRLTRFPDGQHREDPRVRPGRELRGRPRLRHALEKFGE